MPSHSRPQPEPHVLQTRHNRARSARFILYLGQGSILEVQSHHVSFAEGKCQDSVFELSNMTGKRSRPKKGCACIPRVAGNVTGPATHVTDFATSSDFSGEGIEQFPVERLVLKLVEDSARILLCEAIVGLANRF